MTETFIATSWSQKHGSKTRLINTFQVNVKNTQRQKNKIGVENKPCVTSQSKRRIRCYEDNNTKGWDTQETLGLLLDSIAKTVHHTIAEVVILQIDTNLCFEHFPVLSSIV